MNRSVWRRVRQLVQFAVLALFLCLLVVAKGWDGSGLPANLISRFDPLLAVSAMLASRSIIPNMLLALITVVVTLAVGRVWCGWICPLGTVLDLFGPRGRKGIPTKLRQVKYYLLFTVLFLALLGSMAFMYLDPITVFIRGLAGIIFPALARVPAFASVVKGATAVVGGFSLGMAAILVLILLLNVVERRFWCRYLCPLGGFIGLLSRPAWLKRQVKKAGMQPCRLDCPAGTNVFGFVAQASRGRFKQANDLIRETNPLTAVCGHVCPHPCESNCNRGCLDQPVSINNLERFVSDWARQHGSRVKPVPVSRKEKVAVVGAGPAGLTAAYHLRRRGYAVKVFEKLPEAGGMLVAGIPRYRLPREVLQHDLGLIKQHGVEIETGVEVDKAKLAELRQAYQAVFISVGAHQSRTLGIPGEDLPGVVHGVDFLRELNLTEKAKLGSKVAVLGGGDVAIDAARCALRMGSEVTVYYRRSRKEMPARAEEIEEAEEEGVKFEYLATPVRILSEDGKVVGMECIRLELGAPDASGRPRPVPIKGSEFTVDVDTVIPAIGQSTDVSWLEGSGIKVERGRIKTDESGMTTVSGIYAGGDAVLGPATVTEAVGAGRKAAEAMDRYLRGEAPVEAEAPHRIEFEELPAAKQPKSEPRRVPALLAAEARRKGFDEVRTALSRKQALAEARRCLNWNCGECRICAQVCPMGAIDPQDFSSHPSECTVCMDCVAFCPASSSVFKGGWASSPVVEYDPSRRQFLASAATAVVGFGLMSTELGTRTDYPFLLRPPGAHGQDFLDKCVRCGQCIQACPNSALRMALFEGGLGSLWTPILVPSSGYCNYDCHTCGQICPTQAIPPLPLEEKRTAVIGLAQVERPRCISCMLCLDACPTGALEEIEADGNRYPQANPEMCIGCGACEYTCPVEDGAAIRVFAPGVRSVAATPYAKPTPTPTLAPNATEAPTPTPTEPVPSDQRAHVNRDECIRCMICVKTCPQGAISEVMEGDTKWPVVDIDLCIGDGICVEECPRDPKAIQLYDPDKIPTA